MIRNKFVTSDEYSKLKAEQKVDKLIVSDDIYALSEMMDLIVMKLEGMRLANLRR